MLGYSRCGDWWAPIFVHSLYLAPTGGCFKKTKNPFGFFLFLLFFLGRHHLYPLPLSLPSQWAPTSHSPSAVLQNTILSQEGTFTSVQCPGFTFGTLVFAAAARGHLYISWLWGPHRTVANRERVLKWPIAPGHSKRQQAQEFSL